MSGTLNLVVNLLGSDKLTGLFRNLIGTGKTARQVMRDMARETAGLERELKKVRREIAGASGNVTDLVTRERELQRQLERSNAELARQRRLLQIDGRSEEHTSELQSLMRISYAVFCLKKNNNTRHNTATRSQ